MFAICVELGTEKRRETLFGRGFRDSSRFMFSPASNWFCIIPKDLEDNGKNATLVRYWARGRSRDNDWRRCGNEFMGFLSVDGGISIRK